MGDRRHGLQLIVSAENKNIMNSFRILPFLLPVFLVMGWLGQAQATDLLERRIDVSFYQTPVKTALDEVARKGAFEWSYNDRILRKDQRISYIGKQKTVREILSQMLGEEYTFKQSGDYLILKKQKKAQHKLSGYVSDKNGNRLANATVYDRKTLRSVNTDQNGYYEIPVLPHSEIVITKADYVDTTLQIAERIPAFAPVQIERDSAAPLGEAALETLQRELNSASEEVEQFFVSAGQKLRSLNVRDTLYRNFQMSLVPGFGTNHAMSGQVINHLSVNILAGYSRGLEGVEVAGLGNITRENVHGVQVAGLFNEVRGNVSGVQTAGLYNRAGRNVQGVQVSGLINLSQDTLSGVQCAGLFNHTRYGIGITQVAGLYNLQSRGATNTQVAGLFNIGQNAAGAQVAGLLNRADTINGTQVAGLLNRARKVKGVQVGLINSAREIDGLQIGLLNFSRRGGYVGLDFLASDIHQANISLKTGTNRLYTIFTAGLSTNTYGSSRIWSHGIGIGGYKPMGKYFGASLDAIHRHLNEGSYSNRLQEWEQLALCFDVRLFRGCRIAAGPSANLLIINPDNSDSNNFRERFIPRDLPNSRLGDSGRLYGWLGWNAGIKLRF
jgi:hypothetical protein